jgi:hypothetical protein
MRACYWTTSDTLQAMKADTLSATVYLATKGTEPRHGPMTKQRCANAWTLPLHVAKAQSEPRGVFFAVGSSARREAHL